MIDQKICCVEAFLIDEYDVCVDFDEGGTDEYWFDPDDPEDNGLISINSGNPPLTQLIVLLHEAGHVLYRKKNNKTPSQVDRMTIDGKMEVMHEEMMAWYEGWNLSNELRLNVDKELWQENYCSSLLKYIKWVLNESEEN